MNKTHLLQIACGQYKQGTAVTLLHKTTYGIATVKVHETQEVIDIDVEAIGVHNDV